MNNTETLASPASNDFELEALALLRKLTGKPDAQWTSVLQWQAIYQISQRQEDVIVIAATGSGKTMIALLPTLLGGDNELGLLFLPLSSLLTDYKRKLNSMGICYDVFTQDKTHIKPNTRFLLISPEHARSPKWTALLVSLTDSFDVSRLVFDESHIPVTSADYRPVMNYLNQLRILPFQIVLITATCPPSSLEYMMTFFGLEPASTVVFRGATDRPELEYIRLPSMVSLKHTWPKVEQYLQKHTLQDSARAMIFVPYISTGQEAAEHLKCSFYHSNQSPSHSSANYGAQIKQKEKIYHNWYQGQNADGTPNKCIVATSALSAGNDYPSVRLVIHLNTPIEMMTYVQEVSRGGRDGQPAKCVLIPLQKNRQSISPPSEEADYKGIIPMQNYISGAVDCYRFAITSFCDGVGVYCYNDPNRQPCSLCRARPSGLQQKKDQPLPASSQVKKDHLKQNLKRKIYSASCASAFEALSKAAIARKTQYQQKIIEYSSNLVRSLELFGSFCAHCIINSPSFADHKITQCPEFRQHWTKYREWKTSLKYPSKFPNPSCFYCHVPQTENLHQDFGPASQCCYPDIIPIVAYNVFINEDLRDRASEHFGTTWSALQRYSHCLTTLPPEGHLTWMCAIFLWYADNM